MNTLNRKTPKADEIGVDAANGVQKQSAALQALYSGNSNSSQLTMSSREIAERCGKEHKNVRRDIRNMLSELEMGALKFEQTYLDAQGKQQSQYLLPKNLTITLVAGYKVKLRKAIIDRWQELEQQVVQPVQLTGPALMAAALVEAQETLQTQYALIEDMREDVEAHTRLCKAEGTLNITEASKALGVRRDDLFAYMHREGWIYRRGGSKNWLGYADKCKQGLLDHKVTTIIAGGEERIKEQVRVTSKGLSKLAQLLQVGGSA